MPKENTTLCPSAMCKPGNQLIGIVDKAGQVAMLETPITIDAQFVAIARLGRAPEKRFRFTATCIEKSCKQWGNGRCGVGDEVVSKLTQTTSSEQQLNKLRNCAIRPSCRWYSQSGASACEVCHHVITDTTI
jgi:ligand-binding SRPBCC domain-containing protein